MSIILIENYRGFDIEFNTNTERFQCIATDEETKESSSFAAVKKFVDDYKRDNQAFNPFWIEANPNDYPYGNTNKLKVIGIRKDGRFVAENDKGVKEQISDYDTGRYMLVNPKNQDLINRLKELNEKEKIQREKTAFERTEIIKSMNIVTLKDYKKSIG